MATAVALQAAQAVDTSGLLTTILTAVKIFEHIPAAGKAVGYLRDTIRNFQKRKTPEIPDDSILGRLIKAEEERLKRLIEEYNRIESQDEFDELTRERERKRIAKQLCKLLNVIEELMKEFIEHFEKLKSFFCKYAQQA
jgi:hypothetical protein